MDKRMKGIILIILAAFSCACMNAFIKGASGIPLGEKVFYRNIMLFVVSLIMIAKNKSSLFGNKGNRIALIGRGAFGTIGILLGYYALSHMLLPNETVLSDLNIFFIIIFSFIFLKEKVNIIQIIAIVIAFIGILFIVHPGGSVPIIPAIVTIIRGLRAKESPETIVFFLALVSLAFTVPSMMFNYVTPNFHQMLCLLGAGCGIAGFEVCGTIAYKYAAGKEISIFGYTEVLFAAIISLAVWGELPQVIAYIGYALIIVGAIIVFLYDRSLYRKKKTT